MNPCPCGNYGSAYLTCTCTPAQVHKYKSKISGPLLDRIDLQVEKPAIFFNLFFTHSGIDGALFALKTQPLHRARLFHPCFDFRARLAVRRRFVFGRVARIFEKNAWIIASAPWRQSYNRCKSWRSGFFPCGFYALCKYEPLSVRKLRFSLPYLYRARAERRKVSNAARKISSHSEESLQYFLICFSPIAALTAHSSPDFYDVNYRNKVLESLKIKGVMCVTYFSEDYPQALKNTALPPIVLYCKGNLKLLKERY